MKHNLDSPTTLRGYGNPVARIPLLTFVLVLIMLSRIATAQTVRIMPLGNSITWDIWFNDTRTDGERTGYRQQLWLDLRAENFDVDFVGGLSAGYDAVPAFDPDNEGHPGWTSAQIAATVYNFLVASPADIILLHIGTNGLTTSASGVEDILNEVDRFEADYANPITVFVARIINRVPYSATTTTFNDNVEAMVSDRIANLGDQLIMVDMEDSAGIIYQIDTTATVGDMHDYLHPNPKGYPKMAEQWFKALKPYLLGKQCPQSMDHYWNLDEVSGSTYMDEIGGLDATCIDCPASVTGVVGNAQYFSGDKSIIVNDDNSFDWGTSDSYSIALWVEGWMSQAGRQVVIGRRASAAEYWSIDLDSASRVRVTFRDSSNQCSLASSTGIEPVDWNQVVVSRDGSSGWSYLYLNGISADSTYATFSRGFSWNDPMTVGSQNSEMGTFFTGAVDEIALYDTTLSSQNAYDAYLAGLSELGYCGGQPAAPVIGSSPVISGIVGEDYTYDVQASGNPAPLFRLLSHPGGMTIDSTSGLISWTPGGAGSYATSIIAENVLAADTQSFVISIEARPSCPPEMLHYWPLDYAASGHFEDLAGSADAYCTSCPTTVTGLKGQAQEFDRVNDGLSVADIGTFDWSGADDYSIEFWMKKSSGCAGGTQPNNEVIIGRAAAGWWIGVMCEAGANSEKIRAYFQGVDMYSTSAVTDDQWHQVVFVRDNAQNQYRLYVDGEINSTVTSGGNNLAASTAIAIGYFEGGDPGHYRYGGILDELVIFDTALTDADVVQHYNSGQGSTFCVMCGDADASGTVSISDAVFIISYIFGGGPAPTHPEAADVDCSGVLTISDAVYLVSYIFGGGGAPCQGCF